MCREQLPGQCVSGTRRSPGPAPLDASHLSVCAPGPVTTAPHRAGVTCPSPTACGAAHRGRAGRGCKPGAALLHRGYCGASCSPLRRVLPFPFQRQRSGGRITLLPLAVQNAEARGVLGWVVCGPRPGQGWGLSWVTWLFDLCFLGEQGLWGWAAQCARLPNFSKA